MKKEAKEAREEAEVIRQLMAIMPGDDSKRSSISRSFTDHNHNNV